MDVTTTDAAHPHEEASHERWLERGRSLFYRVVATDARVSAMFARLALGLIIFPHAAQKTFGWFGGAGYDRAVASFTQMGIPAPLAVLAILAELLGSIGLILGVFTRAAALAIFAVMLGAIAIVHLPFGFFMNWSGQQLGEGFEYHLLAITLALVCIVEGGGHLSIDRLLMHRNARPADVLPPNA